MFAKLSLTFLLITIIAFFCARPAEAVKGPKITHKVYFDIKQGDKELGRGKYPLNLTRNYLSSS